MIREALRCLESLTPAGLGVLALVLLSAVYAIQVVVVRLVFWFGRQLWPSRSAYVGLWSLKRALGQAALALWSKRPRILEKLISSATFQRGIGLSFLAILVIAFNVSILGQIMELFFRNGRTWTTFIGRFDQLALLMAGVFMLAETAAGLFVFFLQPQWARLFIGVSRHTEGTASSSADGNRSVLVCLTAFAVLLVFIFVGAEAAGNWMRGKIMTGDLTGAWVSGGVAALVATVNILTASLGLHFAFLEVCVHALCAVVSGLGVVAWGLLRLALPFEPPHIEFEWHATRAWRVLDRAKSLLAQP